MKISSKVSAIIVGLIMSFGVFSQAFAMTPSLSVNRESGDNYRITVNGDSNSQITLYRRQTTTLWTTITNFGQTNYSGYFSQVVNIGSDGTNNPIEQYVTVNGQQSQTIQAYPYGSGCTGWNCGTSGLSFSQSSVSLSLGQSASVSVYNSSGSVYVASNSNSSVVSASVSGSTINLYGSNYGSATINICSYNGSQCGNIYVTVGNSVGGLSFNQNNVSLNAGQSTTVNVSSGVYSPSYYVSNNSNSSVAYASISGNQITVTGSSNGLTTLTICLSGNSSMCGYLYVTVNGSGSGNITFSNSNPSLNVGQSQNITIYGGYNYGSYSYYVSNNTNSSVVSASISGNTLYLNGQNSGSATITVCQNNYSSYCGSVYVTVGGSGYNNLTFSSSNPSLNVGQSLNVTIYSSYSGNYYVSNNTNSNVVTASISGATLYLYGQNSGSANVTVCQSSGSNCGTVYVTVSGSNNNSLWFSQNNLNLSYNQSTNVTIYNNYSYSGNYYISNNSSSGVVNASISGNTLYLTGQNNGTTTLTICQNGYSACGTVQVTVGGYNNSGNMTFASMSLPQPVVGQNYNYQLQVTGGTGSYNFSLNNGQLPAGLSLLTNGMITGTAQNTNSASFSVRVNDSAGHVISTAFTLTPVTTGGGVQYQVLGASIYNNGALISENGTVYIVYKNTKTGFASGNVFKALGFKFENVVEGENSGLVDSGYVVKFSNASHPWGSWLKSGKTIYFMHESGLIPVPNYSTFINNGGEDRLVVSANNYDFKRPILPVMGMGDDRLR